MVERVLSSVKKETDRQYFFSKLNNPLWVDPLHKRGYFGSPPGMKKLPDGYVQYPYWPELAYLAKAAKEAPEQVLEILLALPKSDNPRVYDEILSIALELEGRESARLLPKIIEYTELENQLHSHAYSNLLHYWSSQENTEEALELLKRLIPFKEDPRSEAKRQLRKQGGNTLGTALEPSPRFDRWEYQQILELGVRSLAASSSYQTALILIGATADMIRIRMHSDDLENDKSQDYSEIWCRRLDELEADYPDASVALVNTLTFACEQVYVTSPESIRTLDQTLRKQRWTIFKRLRQHLYALNPTEQTLPWIREVILTHGDYSKWEHHFEFQRMISRACVHFGSRLLNEDELSRIVEKILSGPSEDDFREWMGDRYTDADFKLRQHRFHLMQLRPFEALLSGRPLEYFAELEREAAAEPVTDDSYSPYGEVRGGTVSYRSPKSAEELESLTDEDLLAYLNDWNAEHRDRDDWLVEINIPALASVFQALFMERIVPNERRLAFWMAHRSRIGRPIYVAAMVKTMQELVRGREHENLDEWITFCAWVLSHPDSTRVESQTELNEVVVDYPDWGGSRRAVVDFIDECVKKDTNAPVSARGGIAGLIQQVCGQPDLRLDQGHLVFLNRYDPINEAINNTRSRALESLVNFGFWIRRHLPEDPLPEVTDILSRRLAENSDSALTRPERAILAMHFGNLCALNREWAICHRERLFPQASATDWQDAFGSYLRFNRPTKTTFEILREDFEFALSNISLLTITKVTREEFVEKLGQHLFTHYLWVAYPLRGDQSLLERFYEKTNGDVANWAQLFDHVGRLLRNNGKELNKDLCERVVTFFDWRLEVAEPQELQQFTFWLDAECLDPEWRLRSYSKVLDLRRGKDKGLYQEVRYINKLLPRHLPLVTECFLKITNAMDHDKQIYISDDDAKPILRAGLSAEDPRIRQDAERARENLLRLGRFDYLDLG